MNGPVQGQKACPMLNKNHILPPGLLYLPVLGLFQNRATNPCFTGTFKKTICLNRILFVF
jgi:hypothetical protein